MTIIRWKPHTEINTLRDGMNQLFNEFMGPWHSRLDKEDKREMVFHPPVDIKENMDSYQVTMEVPGVNKEDISIEMKDSVLSISGKREISSEEKDETYHRIERYYGSFCRSFTIPTPVDEKKIDAAYKDGILTISIPKKEEAKPKKIVIKG